MFNLLCFNYAIYSESTDPAMAYLLKVRRYEKYKINSIFSIYFILFAILNCFANFFSNVHDQSKFLINVPIIYILMFLNFILIFPISVVNAVVSSLTSKPAKSSRVDFTNFLTFSNYPKPNLIESIFLSLMYFLRKPMEV